MKAGQFSRNFLIGVLLFGVPTLFLSACPKKQVVKKTEEEPADSDELDIHGKDFVSSKNLAAIHFEYDSAELKEDARDILAKNAEFLKKNDDLEVLCEGHTDERGTVGYNLALGQERAQTVRKYYISLGINSKRVGSLSYGKEKPLCEEISEDCWTQNRRVETKVRGMSPADGRKDKDRKPEEEPR